MEQTNTPQLKIAILVRKFPNIVQTYVLNHILSLKNTGAETLIVAKQDPRLKEVHPKVKRDHLLDDTIYVETEIIPLLKQLPSVRYAFGCTLLAILRVIFSTIWFKRGPAYTIKALLRVNALASREFSIIHSHSLFSSYDFLFYKDIFSIPMLTTFHGLVPQNVKMLAADKVKAVIDGSDGFFVNTLFARKQLTDYDCPVEKIYIIPQGTDLDDFPYQQRRIVKDKPIILLSVGRLSVEKGFQIAIRAVAQLKKIIPNIVYNIIGSGPEEKNLLSLINDLQLKDTVNINGSVNTEILLHHYSQSHIFILPSIDFRDGSHTETQGVVLQEAQCSGLPVIASKTGGIPEVIKEGETGLLFDEENIPQLSAHIETLINNENLYHKLHIEGRKDVEDNYSTEVICARLLDTYRSILKQRT